MQMQYSSSLRVTPAADLPRLAKRHGAQLVIINQQTTELDGEADLLIHADCQKVIKMLNK